MDCQRSFLTVPVCSSVAVNMQRTWEVLGFHSQNAAKWIQLRWELQIFLCVCDFQSTAPLRTPLSPGHSLTADCLSLTTICVNFPPRPHLCSTTKRGDNVWLQLLQGKPPFISPKANVTLERIFHSKCSNRPFTTDWNFIFNILFTRPRGAAQTWL